MMIQRGYGMLERRMITSPISRHTRTMLLMLVLLLAVRGAFGSDVRSRSAHCGAGEQIYLYYSPDADQSLPVVMLLHGAGDRAANMVDAWSQFAKKKRIALLAPELPRDPKFEDSAPGVFRCVVEDARHVVGIDPRRVYLFGNSMGGYLAFDGAMFESQ